MGDDPIVLHLGGIHGHEKQEAWELEGFWNAGFEWERREASTSGISLARLPGVLGGWWLFAFVSVGLLGGVYYWRAKRMVDHGTVINVGDMQPHPAHTKV